MSKLRFIDSFDRSPKGLGFPFQSFCSFLTKGFPLQSPPQTNIHKLAA